MERTLERVAEATVSIGGGLATTFPLLLVQQVVVIGILFAAGVALIVLRQAFFYSAPWIARHSVLVAFLVNRLIDFAELAADAFVLVFDAFAAVVDVFEDIANVIPGLNLPGVPFLKVPFDNPFNSPLSPSDIKRGIAYAQDVCAPYDNVYTVGGNAIKLAFAADACSLARFMYPVAWLRPVMGVLAPLYFGSADPDRENCGGDAGHSMQLSAVCCGLGAGYILLEAILPAFIIVLLLVAIGGAIARVIWECIVLGGIVSGKAVVRVFELLDKLEV